MVDRQTFRNIVGYRLQEILQRGAISMLGFVVDRRLAQRQEITVKDIFIAHYCVPGAGSRTRTHHLVQLQLSRGQLRLAA